MEAYFELKSVTQTQRRFVIDFPGRNPPSRLTIRRLVLKFRETGYVTNANKGHSGRPRSARTAINTEIVRQRLEESPRKSTRRLSQEISLSRTTVRRILNTDLHLFPYRVQILQAQTATNREERLAFCRNISQRLPTLLIFLLQITSCGDT